MEAIRQFKPEITSVIVASSANIYGDQGRIAIEENSPTKPINDYSVSKVSMELVCQLYKQEFPILITRPFNYTGVGQSLSFLVPKIVHHFKQKKSEILLGNLNVYRDISDVRDVIKIYDMLLKMPHFQSGEIVNIASEEVISLKEIIEICEGLSQHSIKVTTSKDFTRNNEIGYLCGSNKKLKNLIQLPALTPISNTIQWMFES